MSVGDIRQRICSVVAMHRFSGRQYRSGIRSMPRNEGSIRFKKDEEKDMKGRGGFRSSRSSTRNSGSTSISRS